MTRQTRKRNGKTARDAASRARVRLDGLLVERGIASGRDAAQAMIADGRVSVNGSVVLKPAALAAHDSEILHEEGPSYVSRGGIKLAGALDAFGLSPDGLTCALMSGASTGGFTDCLLQRGASRVYAVDVGYGQLAWSLRNDPRVTVMERRNARHPLPIDEPIGLAVADVSFISLRLVLPSVIEKLVNRRLHCSPWSNRNLRRGEMRWAVEASCVHHPRGQALSAASPFGQSKKGSVCWACGNQ